MSDRTPGNVNCVDGKMGGKPCLDGTRIDVRCIWWFIEDGWDNVEIVEQYPTIEASDVECCRRLYNMARKHFRERVLDAFGKPQT